MEEESPSNAPREVEVGLQHSTESSTLSDEDDLKMTKEGASFPSVADAKPENVSFETSFSDSSTVEKESGSDEAERKLKKRYVQLLKYIVKSEEVQNKASMFTKVYEQNDSEDVVDEDWSVNHYLRTEHAESPKDKAAAATKKDTDDTPESKTDTEFGVILTSYEYLPFRAKCPRDTTQSWITIPRTPAKPVIDAHAEQYLHWKRENHPDSHRFEGCQSISDMLPLLSYEEIDKDIAPSDDKDKERLRKFLREAVDYHTFAPLQKAYKLLFDWQAFSEGEAKDMMLGFGHVRVLLTTAKNNKQYEQRIVNGPLFEVPVEVFLDDHYHLHINPKVTAEIDLNEEVISAIISTGKCSSKLITKLHELAKRTNVSSLDPFESSTYKDFLETACRLQCGAKLRCTSDYQAHVPPDNYENMIITDALCLYSRKKKSSIFSSDSRRLIEALKNGRLEMTDPIRGLLVGPDYSCERTTESETDRLVYTLPASKRQRQIGTRLLLEGEPVVTVVGPPGTGKTHSIVNISATALSENKSIVVSSSNPRALKAFMDKLPQSMRDLALDMSSVKAQDISQVQAALEKMTTALMETKRGEADVKRLEEFIKKKKAELRSIFEQFQSTVMSSLGMLSDKHSLVVIEKASEIGDSGTWLVPMILAGKISNCALILEKCRLFDKPVSFGQSVEAFFANDGHIQELKQRINRQVESASHESRPTFSFNDTPKVKDEELAYIKVSGKSPEYKSDWEVVLSALEILENLVAPSCCCGVGKNELILEGENSSFVLRSTFIGVLEKCCDLEVAMGCLDSESRRTLVEIIESFSTNYEQQDVYQTLTLEIQALESELVFNKVIVSLKQKIGNSQHSILKKMCQRLSKMKQSHLASGNVSSERGGRYLDDFAALFNDAAKFMPFLVMTMDQTSQFLGPNHICDIGIVDEASQSSCTAVNFMARCRQMLVVGDDKQVSPSTTGVSEGSIRALKQSLPGISTDEQLLPEYSFFDLMQASFPLSEVSLCEHFRCAPEIIGISNKLFYHSKLVPLKLGGKAEAIRCEHLRKGFRDQKKKTNEVEAERIADLVYKEIQRTAEQDSDYQTMAIISMGGPHQSKLIQKLVEDKTNDLMAEYGSDIVDRHMILYGTSKECQGDERDIVFVSAVYSPVKNKKGEKQKLPQDDNWKEWNVALTRSKHKLVLFRSFDFKDLKPNDIRSRVFRLFSRKDRPETSKVDLSSKVRVFDRHQLVVRASSAMSSMLTARGYHVRQKGGIVWNEALCVESASESGSPSLCVLLNLESCGETKEEWQTMFDEQLSLERAGRSCLRVNCLSLLLNFENTFGCVLKYLTKMGLPPSRKRSSPEAATAVVGETDSPKRMHL